MSAVRDSPAVGSTNPAAFFLLLLLQPNQLLPQHQACHAQTANGPRDAIEAAICQSQRSITNGLRFAPRPTYSLLTTVPFMVVTTIRLPSPHRH